MRAIIIATRGVDGAPILSERLGACLLPLLDRPFLQHGVESLIRWGVTEIDFVLSHLPEKVEALLGTGERWGCQFRYHLVRDPERPYHPLAELLAAPRSRPLIVGQAESLPLTESLETARTTPLLFMHGMESTKAWSGWAIVPARIRIDLPKNASFQSVYQALKENEGAEESLENCLWIKDGTTLIAATQTLMARGIAPLLHTAREVEAGVWLSRDVGIHPAAQITPPVYIDEECRIGKKAHIGPYTVLGKGCVVDEKSRIKNSVILPGSYIGKELSLTACVVDKNCLTNTVIDSEIIISEPFIIGDLSKKEIRRHLVTWSSRIIGALLLITLSPLLLLTLATRLLQKRGPHRPTLEVVSLPTASGGIHWHTFPFGTYEASGPDPACWEARWWHFFLVFLPGLIHVAKGQLRFVGLGPRTRASIEALPSDWKSIYLTGKGGLITEAMLHFGPYPSDDEYYAAETVYTVSSGFFYDLKLLLKYLSQLCGISPRPVAIQIPPAEHKD